MSTRIVFKEISGVCELSAKLHIKRAENWRDVLHCIDPGTMSEMFSNEGGGDVGEWAVVWVGVSMSRCWCG